MTGLIRGLQPQAPHKRSRMSRHGLGADIGRKELACEIRRTEQDSLFLWRNPGQEQGSRLLRILDEPRFRRGFRKHLEDVPTRVAPPRLDRIESLKHLGSAHAESVSNDRQAVQDLHYGSLISVQTDEPGTLANQGPIKIDQTQGDHGGQSHAGQGSPVYPPQAIGQTGRDQHHQSDTGEKMVPLNPDQCLRADEPDTNAVNQTVATQNQA